MRLGCVGCLFITLLGVVFGVAAAGALFFSANIFEDLEIPAPPITAGDGFRAQQKLYEIVLRDNQRSSRQDPIILTERELNAFLTRHLVDTADLSLSRLSVGLLEGNVVEVRGKTELRNLMQGFPFAQIAPYLPAGKLDESVWVRVRGRLKLERGTVRRDREYGTLEVTEFALGSQPMGVWLLKLMLGRPGQNLLRFQVPRVIKSVGVEEGRVVIRTGPS